MTPSALLYLVRPTVLAAAARSKCKAEFRTKFIPPGARTPAGVGFSVTFHRGGREVGGLREFWVLPEEPKEFEVLDFVEMDLRGLEEAGVLTPRRMPEAW